MIGAAFRDALPHYDLANQMIKCFADAGLPTPELFRETPVGGGEQSPLMLGSRKLCEASGLNWLRWALRRRRASPQM